MRITRDFLLKTAQTRAALAAYNDHSIICIYLVGSVLQESPLLGNTADIDLVCVHAQKPRRERELIRLNDDLHLDLAHYPASLYDQPRHLRSNVWIGSSLVADPKVLHDDGHWFEFTQAGAAWHFQAPEHTLERLHSLAASARSAWLELSALPSLSTADLLHYLKAVEEIGNAVACLSGPPLTERRFWLEYPRRAAAFANLCRSHDPSLETPAVRHPLPDLAELFCPQPLPADLLSEFTPAWHAALDAAAGASACPVGLLPARRRYYTEAALELQEACPLASLWILLRTWCRSVLALRSNSRLSKPFNDFRSRLGLGEEQGSEKLQSMDTMLDALEEHLDAYAARNGLA
jgi:hypothetical protein